MALRTDKVGPLRTMSPPASLLFKNTVPVRPPPKLMQLGRFSTGSASSKLLSNIHHHVQRLPRELALPFTASCVHARLRDAVRPSARGGYPASTAGTCPPAPARLHLAHPWTRRVTCTLLNLIGTLEPCRPRSYLSVRAHASCLTTKLNVTATCSALDRISPLFASRHALHALGHAPRHTRTWWPRWACPFRCTRSPCGRGGREHITTCTAIMTSAFVKHSR